MTHGDRKKPIEIGATTTRGRLELWVANSGEPISDEGEDDTVSALFRGEVRSSQQGLGLGLYIASEIARVHGGKLSVNSHESETRFTLTMPL